MVAVLARSEWTGVARPATKLTPLDGRVEGVAVHYTGSNGTVAHLDPAKMLRGEYADHVGGRGWTDIAYQAAISMDGRVWDCRGIEFRSAANGDQDVNTRFGSITFLLGTADLPTPAMIAGFRAWRTGVWLKRWPKATRVVGHRDLHATACPGDALYRLVQSGDLTTTGGAPAQPTEDDMPLTPDDLNKIAATVWGARFGESPTAGVMLQRAGVDVDALATAIVAKLPAGGNLDAAAVAAATADELSRRLVR